MQVPKKRTNPRRHFRRQPTTIPIEALDGIKARSQHGSFARNWWANRWIGAMERLVDPGRLSRGRSYARKGQVLSINEVKAGVKAEVQGSRTTPYEVIIQVAPLTDEQWDKVIDALVEQALFTARLLAGEMPRDIEEVFRAAGVSLFPSKRSDLTTECSCPDWANPCKHVAAAHYILGERFDEDPFLLFRMRGRNQGQILQALRKRRSGEETSQEQAAHQEQPEVVNALEDCLENFWEPGIPLGQIPIAIRLPEIEMPLLKRLGDPGVIADPGLQEIIGPAYQGITRKALSVAFGREYEEKEEKKEESQ